MSSIQHNWITAKVGDFGELIRGVTYSKDLASDERKSGYTPILRANNINDGLQFDDFVYVQNQLVSTEQRIRKNDMVFAMSSGSKKHVGKSAIATSDFEGSFGAFCGVLRPSGNIEAKYLAYYFQSGEFRKHIEEISKGTNINNLKREHILDFEFRVPPLNEQKRIVAKIEELFSELDKGIESLKTAREQLKVYRQAVLKHAFEKFSERLTLESVSDAVGGYAFKSPSFKTDVGKYQVIRMGNLRPGLIREDESPVFLDDVDYKILERYQLKIDDVLITLTGTRNKRDYGYTAIVKKHNYLVNQRIAYLRFSHQYLPSFFLYYSWTEDFKRQFFEHETGNVGQGNVGMKAIRTTLVPKATIDEQRQIINVLDANFATIENLEITIEKELQKSEVLRQAILKKAFSGELVAQDPNDEPASILLERIRAEKESQSPQRKTKSKRGAA